jgi:hypothetical protein
VGAAESTYQVWPLTVKDKLKAKHLLEKEKVGAGAGLIGEECIPGTIEGYVDVRVLNPCQYLDHVCVSNPWSSLGGTCIGIGTKVGGFVLSNHVLEEGEESTVYTYLYKWNRWGEMLIFSGVLWAVQIIH